MSHIASSTGPSATSANIAGDYEGAGYVREIRRQVFGDGVDEVVLPIVAAEQDSSSNFSRKNLSRRAAVAFQRGLERLAIWRARARSRAELMTLSDHMLKDIGLSRSEAYREYSKSFWRP